MNRFKTFSALALAALLTGGQSLQAQSTLSIPDTSGMIDSATDTVNSITAIVAGVVGFFLVVRIIKWVRK